MILSRKPAHPHTRALLEKDPNHADGLYNMGAIYANLGQATQAREYWSSGWPTPASESWNSGLPKVHRDVRAVHGARYLVGAGEDLYISVSYRGCWKDDVFERDACSPGSTPEVSATFSVTRSALTSTAILSSSRRSPPGDAFNTCNCS